MVLTRRQFGKVSLTALGTAAIAGTGTLALDGCSTAWITTVENDLPVVVNIVSGLVGIIATATGNGLLSAAVGAVVSEAVNAAVASLSALEDAVKAYSANQSAGTLQAVIAALTAAQGDIGKVVAALPAGSVSAVVETVIIAGLGTAITILSSIQALIPGAAPAALTAKATASVIASKPVLPNAAALKAGYNCVLWIHGYGGQQLH